MLGYILLVENRLGNTEMYNNYNCITKVEPDTISFFHAVDDVVRTNFIK